MKTKQILIAGIAATSLLTLSISGTSAYGGGQGGGQGFGKTLTTEQRAELQAMSDEDRQEYITKLKAEAGYTSGGGQGKAGKEGKKDHNPADMLIGVELQELSDAEKDMLYYGYSEELLAHDMYRYFFDLYGVQTFANIAASESEHMLAVKALLDRYELEIPTDYGELTNAFANLKAEGSESLTKALEVGVKIELLDIEDIAETIRTTDNDDLKIIFTNIGGASYNHLRGFLNALDNNGLTTDIDYSDYLTETELATKGGGLKVKMAQKMEAEGEILPEQATAKAIQENCDKEQSGNQGNMGKSNKGQGLRNSSNMNKGNGNGRVSSVNNNSNNSQSYMKNKYRSYVEDKYGERLDSFDNEKLEIIAGKVDDLIVKVNSGDYSDTVKEKYIALLLSLKDIILEKISEDDLDLESLFN